MTEQHLTDGRAVSKPKQFWDSALRAVKGDSTQQAVEDFTAEMTLVAEGLCEDQARLRSAVENLSQDQDRQRQRAESELKALETALDEHQRDTDRRLDSLTRRLDAIENRQKSRKERSEKLDLISRLTILAGIVCGSWVLVTLISALIK
ncbi:MAG: hypothetical protein IKP40_00790 [Clostridia bacterium]|nr:hypothetical protein [Clostridia bacterium]